MNVDQFTVAALVWFLVDTSTASANDIVDGDASGRAREDDELLERHGGSWAYDSIGIRGGPWNLRDATEDLLAVAAAFRRRNGPDAPPGKRQRTISIAPPRDDAAPGVTSHQRIHALCDDFADKIQSHRLDLDALFQILRSVPRGREWFDTVFLN